MNNLYLDIETIPSQRPDIKEKIAENIQCPGNIRKAESIEKWEIEQKPQAIEEAWLKTSLDGAYGEVISIAWIWNNEESQGIIRTLEQSEKMLLKQFIMQLDKLTQASSYYFRFVGHNIINFDLRFIWQRCLINDITSEVPHFLNVLNSRPTDYEKVFDTMLYWSGAYSKHGEWAGVDKLCVAFNIESPKTIMDGSEVWEYIQKGEYDKVLEYNKKDVETERQLAIKMGIENL